eukprot:4254795-Pyramimonas_sp.AAC.1
MAKKSPKPFPQLMLEGPAYPQEPPEQVPALPEQPPGPRVHIEAETPELHLETSQDAPHHQYHVPDPAEPPTPFHYENEETPQVQEMEDT